MVSNSAMRSSLHTLLLLCLSSTTLAATNLIPHKPPARLLAQLSPSSHFQDASVVINAQCRPGEVDCNAGCMPSIAECCSDGAGYCRQGYSCVTDGCCPVGHTCSDEITCDNDEVPCGGKKCMPKDAVCCVNGSYCHAGEECSQNGFTYFCERVGGSGNPHNDNGSKTTGGTIGTAETTSSRRQNSTTHGEAPASTSAETQTQAEESTSTSTSSHSTSSGLIITGRPTVTPFLPIASTTSATTTEFTSSSTTEVSTATTTSGGNPTAVKTSGATLMLVFVSMMMMAL